MCQQKIDNIADSVPLQKIDNGKEKGKLLIVGWGSTYGSIKAAVKEAIAEGYDVSHAHIKYLNPLPKNLGEILYSYEKVIVPEMNNGQLVKVLRDKYLVPAVGFNKIKGMPFSAEEIKNKIVETLK